MMLYYYLKRRTTDDVLILRFVLCIRASAADAAAVNPKGISSNPVFSNGARILPRNPPDCTSCNILSPLFSLIRSIQWTSEFSKHYWRNI